jgi:limonene-1,2-epoxide hydrolase
MGVDVGVAAADRSPAAVVRAFFRAYEGGDLEATMSFLHGDAVYTDGTRGVHVGADAIRVVMTDMMPTAPRVTREVTRTVADERTVMIERVDHFDYEGKTIRYEIAVAFDVDGEGRITRSRDYYDIGSIRDQILA